MSGGGGGSSGIGTIMAANMKEAELQNAANLTREQSVMGVLNELCKTIIALNGGAAVAMGALLQAIIDRPSLQPIRAALLYGIAVATVGMLLGTLTFMARFFSMREPAQRGATFDNKAGQWAFWLGVAAMLAFVLAAAIPLFAAFLKL